MYVCMARKARLTLSLSRDVVDELDDEPNMSAVVDDLLRNHYDL